ncbi:MAG: DNA-binding protein WhiA [Oscillospiraceae bacterium]|nr:DNA-binding protein WhiA [Oscillospiraceae bacterium]
MTSFSVQVKQELLRVSAQQQPCCAQAKLYGMLLFGASFNAREISLRTELRDVADYAATQLQELALVQAQLQQSTRKVELTVPRADDRRRLLERMGHSEDEPGRRIARENFACDDCPMAFLRGVFLVCAAVNAPQRQYHLEFSVGYKKLCNELVQLLGEHNLPPKICQRKGAWLLYYKDSEHIEDVLASLGAQTAVLEFMQTKVEKDLRNNVNRVMNFDMANLDRATAAAAQQLHAIAQIRSTMGLDSLTEPLREAAELREQNPEASLAELCELCSTPVTRSGMNHRLKKLVAMAAQF